MINNKNKMENKTNKTNWYKIISLILLGFIVGYSVCYYQLSTQPITDITQFCIEALK